jgi:hypothetical protein
VSRNGNKTSPTKLSEAQDQAIRAALERVYRRYSDGSGPRDKDRRTSDFVFHMTDWYNDLRALAEMFTDPEAHDEKRWNEVVFGFLAHASGHVAAACELAEIEPVRFDVPAAPADVKPRATKRRSRAVTRPAPAHG